MKFLTSAVFFMNWSNLVFKDIHPCTVCARRKTICIFNILYHFSSKRKFPIFEKTLTLSDYENTFLVMDIWLLFYFTRPPLHNSFRDLLFSRFKYKTPNIDCISSCWRHLYQIKLRLIDMKSNLCLGYYCRCNNLHFTCNWYIYIYILFTHVQ